MSKDYGVVNQIPVTKQRMLQIENKMNSLIEDYLSINGWELDQPIELKDFIEDHLGYTFELEHLPEDILGCTYFESKRVIIDKNLYESNPKRANFTIAHEISHIHLHEKYYQREKVQKKLDFVTNEVPASINRDSKDPARPEAERQADWGASYILMPKDLLLHYWKDLQSNYKDYLEIPLTEELEVQIRQKLINDLTDELQVSRQALEIRIKNLGLELFGFMKQGDSIQIGLFG